MLKALKLIWEGLIFFPRLESVVTILEKVQEVALGRSIETSISEDPQPHPQSLRFFEVEDRHFRNFEVFRG